MFAHIISHKGNKKLRQSGEIVVYDNKLRLRSGISNKKQSYYGEGWEDIYCVFLYAGVGIQG